MAQVNPHKLLRSETPNAMWGLILSAPVPSTDVAETYFQPSLLLCTIVTSAPSRDTHEIKAEYKVSDNAAHAILVEAADEAGWGENTMLLMTTRFIAGLSESDPAALDRFKACLHEQLAEERGDAR
jgi:hypothetical protein